MKRIFTSLITVSLISLIACNSVPEPNKQEDIPMPPEVSQQHPGPDMSGNRNDNQNRPIFSGKENLPDDMSRKEQMEQIRMQKIAYMTQELNLTVEESQAFWPVYNNYWDAFMKLQHEQFKANKTIEKQESPSLSDVELLASFYAKRAEIINYWGQEFSKVIPENKVVKVFVAEERFKNYLLRKGPWRPNSQQPQQPQQPQK